MDVQQPWAGGEGELFALWSLPSESGQAVLYGHQSRIIVLNLPAEIVIVFFFCYTTKKLRRILLHFPAVSYLASEISWMILIAYHFH